MYNRLDLGRSSPWRYLVDSGPCDFAFNMAMDEALLEAMPRLRRPVLRFYSWSQRAASFGYFQKHAEVERLTRLRPLVLRPTGGGLVPHDGDWTYSLAFPTSDLWYSFKATESYRRVHEWLQAAFAKLNTATELALSSRKAQAGQCFAGHERFDLLWRGQKIAGAAQRRRRDGLLIQGSVQPPPIGLARADWQKAMVQAAVFEPAIRWQELEPDALLAERMFDLAERKYRQAAYNEKR